MSILGTKNAVERSLIAFRYPQMHSKKLKDLMKKETSGDFGFATQLLALPCIEVSECRAEAAVCPQYRSSDKHNYLNRPRQR